MQTLSMLLVIAKFGRSSFRFQTRRILRSKSVWKRKIRKLESSLNSQKFRDILIKAFNKKEIVIYNIEINLKFP